MGRGSPRIIVVLWPPSHRAPHAVWHYLDDTGSGRETNMRQRLIFVAHVGFALLTCLLLTIDLVLAEVSAGHGFMLADVEIAALHLYFGH